MEEKEPKRAAYPEIALDGNADNLRIPGSARDARYFDSMFRTLSREN